MTAIATDIKQPIILVGTHRSGTTMLGKFLGSHPDVAYWEEPRHIWTWGNAYNEDDVLTREAATDKISEHIRSEFAGFVRQHDGHRFLEKTPSNCLRLPFVHAVFPDARFIHIVRDGRAVIRSTDEIMQSGVPLKRVWRRAKETPIREWPAYASRAWGAVSRRLGNKPLQYWGPRPPGWKTWAQEDPTMVVAAKQWAGTVGRALDDSAAIPSEQLLQIRYEEMMTEPIATFERLCDFVHLQPTEETLQFVRETVDPSRQEKWKHALDDQTLRLVRPVLEPTLERLGYEW